ncbi:MAG TPA: hypothetical protein VF865_01400 [Acidobacteriaceae bacterium]
MLRAAAPADAILGRDPSISKNPKEAMSGFVGMEYYGLILNRTYLVFVAPNGLYGWKVEGPVSAGRPQFYEPYQKMLDDPELTQDRGAVEDLAKLKGGFFIPGSNIAYVVASDIPRDKCPDEYHHTGKRRDYKDELPINPPLTIEQVVDKALRDLGTDHNAKGNESRPNCGSKS